MGAGTKMGGVNRPAEQIENTGDPRGQFGRYLRHLLDSGRIDGADLAKTLGVSVRTVQTWAKGQAGPAFGDLDRVAVALGHTDWSRLAAAVVRYSK